METIETIYDKLDDVHYFLNYRADESNYGLQLQSVLYSAHKLSEIYSVYCVARSNLHYLDNQDYGHFAKEELGIKFVRMQLLMNAIHYYNILVDLSWQLVWFSIRSDLNNTILTSKTYMDIARECNFEILKYNLTLLKDFKMRDKILNDFFNDSLVREIREKWNYLKHRGTYYFAGLGQNPSWMMVGFNDMRTPIVNRPDVDIDELKELLVSFDKKYFKYIEHIMSVVFPKDFLSNRDLLNSSINYFMNYKDDIAKFNDKKT